MSADFGVSFDENGVYRLGDWPVTVAVTEGQGRVVTTDIQILDGGPRVVEHMMY